ncbi:MAG: biotin/lipoyl-binding protein [Planctomycetaceae bacterium]
MSSAGDPRGPVAGTAASPASAAGDELVQRARREIAEMVREVAQLSRQSIPRDLFFASLIDRTTCAIAAEGAVVWDCRHHPPRSIVRTGHVTDASIPATARAAHDCLLQEVVRSGMPVVVPSTPGATDPFLPSNPTRFPVAAVPIADVPHSDQTSSDSAARFILEVFLEDEAGVATQRGYLRFVTQMADLASEFLRSDEIRAARRRERLYAETSASLLRLHDLGSSQAIAAAIVDITAERFDAARVSLVKHGIGKPQLLAVSHIESIDHRGQASRQLLDDVASLTFSDGERLRTLVDDTACSAPEPSVTTEQTDATLVPLVIARDSHDQLRLYLQSSHPTVPDGLTQAAMEDWFRQSLSILATRMQLESVPLAKIYLAITPKYLSISPSRLRRGITTLAAIAVAAMIASLPTPVIVTMPATLRPAGTRVHYAPSDAAVERVEVKHGQSVNRGDVLLRLRDWAIEEQLSTLSARRGVLRQRLTRSIASLVEAPGRDSFAASHRSAASDEELVQQQRLIEEEITGLDDQIALVEATRDRLTIRADQAGRVDAWQTELTATGKPVRRGDALLRVEPHDATWMVDAKIPQSRVGVVLERLEQVPPTVVQVATLAAPHDSYPATFTRRAVAAEPVNRYATQPTDLSDSALGIELAIQTQPGDATFQERSRAWSHGAPATVTIECNKRPLVLQRLT